MMTKRFSDALELAVEAHDGQFRKATTIPYIAHPLGVASIALEFGADEDQAIAALLHDVLEDGGPQYRDPIARRFGRRVLEIVDGCTDGVPDQDGRKADWQARKTAYLAHLRTAPDAVILVSGADKLHNARAIVADLLVHGLGVFDRFNASRAQTLWYYGELRDLFVERGAAVAPALKSAVDQMERLANAGVGSTQ